MYARICSVKKRVEQKLAHDSAAHPVGFLFFLLLAMPMGILFAVLSFAFPVGLLMGLLFGWL